MISKDGHGRSVALHVPQIKRVQRGRHEHIIHIRIPLDKVAAILVQIKRGLLIELQLVCVRHRPQLYLRIVAACGQHRLVERVVLYVGDRAAVSMCGALGLVVEREPLGQVVVPHRAHAAAARMIDRECYVLHAAVDQAADRV